MKTLLEFSLVAILLSGCASAPPPAQATWKVIENKTVDEKNYTIGDIQKCSVGSTMIRRQKFQFRKLEHNGYVIPNKNATLSLAGQNIIFAKDKLYRIDTILHKNETYQVVRFNLKNGNLLGLHVNHSTEKWDSGKIAGQTGLFVPESVFNWKNARLIPEDTKFVKAKKYEVQKSGPYINYEIIYSGINDKTFNLLYREYDSEDFAKTAFFQNLSYTLKDTGDTLIRFKDTEISVKTVGNEGIEFAVLKDDSAQ
ncbi:hypothetical protein OAM21_03685 [Verrucomicrobia bacterium]|nr:hypothetical protein [Verrucomicrobiota bacterium]